MPEKLLYTFALRHQVTMLSRIDQPIYSISISIAKSYFKILKLK
jgi:hypothetical protein